MPAVLLQPTSTAVAVVDWESVQSEVWSNGCWGAWGGRGSWSQCCLGGDGQADDLFTADQGLVSSAPFFFQALLMIWQKI